MYLENCRKKQECLNLEPKILDLGMLENIIEKQFENNIVIFEISTFEFVNLHIFAKYQKCLNFGPKITFWDFFDQEYVIWVFLAII